MLLCSTFFLTTISTFKYAHFENEFFFYEIELRSYILRRVYQYKSYF